MQAESETSAAPPIELSTALDFSVEGLETLDAPGFLGWDKDTWVGFAAGAGLAAGIAAT
ncbi:hypothetical protein [Streptomyces chrestomyceticus]|uniref:hypothetical protein n=1 Tax=Streptomyces chrestomyceticus TaxID=68185 RepID=UPI0035A916F8